MGEDEELIGRGGDYMVDAAGVLCGGRGAKGEVGGHTRRPQRTEGGHPGRSRGGPIAAGGWRQGEALRILLFRHVHQ